MDNSKYGVDDVPSSHQYRGALTTGGVLFFESKCARMGLAGEFRSI